MRRTRHPRRQVLPCLCDAARFEWPCSSAAAVRWPSGLRTAGAGLRAAAARSGLWTASAGAGLRAAWIRAAGCAGVRTAPASPVAGLWTSRLRTAGWGFRAAAPCSGVRAAAPCPGVRAASARSRLRTASAPAAEPGRRAAAGLRRRLFGRVSPAASSAARWFRASSAASSAAWWFRAPAACRRRSVRGDRVGAAGRVPASSPRAAGAAPAAASSSADRAAAGVSVCPRSSAERRRAPYARGLPGQLPGRLVRQVLAALARPERHRSRRHRPEDGRTDRPWHDVDSPRDRRV